MLTAALRNDHQAPLRSPSEQHLRRGFAMLFRSLLDCRMVEKQRGVVAEFHPQVPERLRPNDEYAVTAIPSALHRSSTFC